LARNTSTRYARADETKEGAITMMRLTTLKKKLEALGYFAYLHEPDRLTLSAEESHNGRYPAQYDFDGVLDEDDVIARDARDLATKADGYWEWVNPGELAFVRN
jgi:hypothetical protein